jgi:flagellar hook assembly protein FlgD
VKGQRVKTITNLEIKGGNSEVVWNGFDEDGKNLSSGLYFVKINSNNQSVMKKILKMK